MPFIGIIAKENDCNYIKNEITKLSKKNRFEIINLNKKSIENVKNIKFDTLIINEKIEEFFKNSKYLEEIIEKSNYIIINSDIITNLTPINNNKAQVITYGLNSKASLTISSVNEDSVLICIQRAIKSVYNKIIEEQEINVKLENNNINRIYNILPIVIILEIYGEILQKNKKINFLCRQNEKSVV